MTEREIVKALKCGARGAEELKKRRQALLDEQEELRRAVSDWEKLDRETADVLRASYMGDEEIEQLKTEELSFRRVRRALWEIEPGMRRLLLMYYDERQSAEEVAGALCVSKATFFRRRRSAVRLLLARLSSSGG